MVEFRPEEVPPPRLYGFREVKVWCLAIQKPSKFVCFFLVPRMDCMITNPSSTVCWPGGARGLHTSPDCDHTCLCCSCDSHCFVPPAMETRFKTTVGDVTLPPVSHPKSLARRPSASGAHCASRKSGKI